MFASDSVSFAEVWLTNWNHICLRDTELSNIRLHCKIISDSSLPLCVVGWVGCCSCELGWHQCRLLLPPFMVSVPNYFLCIYVFQPEYSQFSKFLFLLVISLHYFKVSKILKLSWPSLIPKLQKRFNLNPEEALAFPSSWFYFSFFLLFQKSPCQSTGIGVNLGSLLWSVLKFLLLLLVRSLRVCDKCHSYVRDREEIFLFCTFMEIKRQRLKCWSNSLKNHSILTQFTFD